MLNPSRIITPTVEIGKYTYYSHNLRLGAWLPGEKVIIGSYCSLADHVTIFSGGMHRTDIVSTYPFDFARSYLGTSNTTIGNDVWIGYGAMILGGAQVGDGAVIAAGSVVFSDIPPYAIAAGNPAQILRFRFSKKMIARLLRIAWWDWPDARILGNIEWFYRPIGDFVDRFDPQGETHGE
jgi:acetyltransferase-like isoleucine patch superfamily enzyme